MLLWLIISSRLSWLSVDACVYAIDLKMVNRRLSNSALSIATSLSLALNIDTRLQDIYDKLDKY